MLDLFGGCVCGGGVSGGEGGVWCVCVFVCVWVHKSDGVKTNQQTNKDTHLPQLDAVAVDLHLCFGYTRGGGSKVIHYI